jgi:hypothetical protein
MRGGGGMKRTPLGRMREKLKKKARAEHAIAMMQVAQTTSMCQITISTIQAVYDVHCLTKSIRELRMDSEELRLP